MIEVLKCLKNDYGVFEIKAEFEAEGSRMEEMMRLKDITSYVGLPIILKIGGGEAVTDIYNALSIGVKGIIAPMIETPYALSKYLNIIKNIVPEDNRKDIEFAFNVETITAYQNLDKILELPDINLLTGVMIGRVDLTQSMGLNRKDINTSREIWDICLTTLKKLKQYNLKTGLGGAIAKEALPPITAFSGWLDKFETRKVVFPVASYKYGEVAIIKANEFELLWLESKKRYYSRIRVEDEKRIQMLKERIC